MTKPTKTRGQKAGQALAIGGGIALTAALIAGAYFLYGKDGAKNRKKLRGWAIKMKGEILEKMEELPEVSEAAYNKVIEEVAKHYKEARNIDAKEIAEIVRELKGHWFSIKKQIATAAKTGKKTPAKKAVKKTAKRKTATKKAK